MQVSLCIFDVVIKSEDSGRFGNSSREFENRMGVLNGRNQDVDRRVKLH